MASVIIEEVRDVMRRRHYSIHTEKSYIDWIKRYIKFHSMRSRADLGNGARKVEDFLTHLAREEHVAPSTQNQALNALVFFYKQVLGDPLDDSINAERSAPRIKNGFGGVDRFLYLRRSVL